jgi:hypothetical protein
LSGLSVPFICWGPEFVVVYNDANLPIFGERKHPKTMGQRGRECYGAGSTTALTWRVTAVCANNLPLIDAPVCSATDV